MSLATALAPFQTRSYRFLWPADLCTTWALEMETLILGWYVFMETKSVVLLTVFGSLQFVGTLVSPMLGMLGDRLGLRQVLVAMRLWYALLAGVLLGLTVSGVLHPTAVLVVAALSGLIRPSDMGIRSALVAATLPPAHLLSALGVSRTTQDSAKVGGALAGAGFMAAFGMGPAYLVITGLYLAGALLTLGVLEGRAPAAAGGAADARIPAASAAPRLSPWRELAEGLSHVWHMPRLRAAMGVAALVNLTAFPLTMGLMPYTAREVFHLDQQGLGTLVASFALGALIGSLGLSALGRKLPPARTMVAATLLWHVFLAGFVMSTQLSWAVAMLVMAGIGQSLSMVTLSIILLRSAEARMRGRVMGVRMLAIYTLPLGLLVAGALIPLLGYRPTGLLFVATGLVFTGGMALLWREELIRRASVANAP